MYEDLCIITPTLNEKDNISRFIELCKKFYPMAKLIVSDDGSKDGTKEIVLKYKGVIFLDRKKEPVHGLAASVVDAINTCDRDYFIVIDADLQHPIEKIKDIYDRLNKGYDIVIGRRIKITEKWPIFRKLISKTAILLGRVRLMFKRVKIKDVMSGFFGFRTNLAREILSDYYYKFELNGYKILFDFLKYLPKRAKVSEMDYVFSMRKQGKSKINKKIMFYYFRSLFK